MLLTAIAAARRVLTLLASRHATWDVPFKLARRHGHHPTLRRHNAGTRQEKFHFTNNVHKGTCSAQGGVKHCSIARVSSQRT